MPLVKIDVIKGRRSPSQLRILADVVQNVMLQEFKAPPKDRYQVSHPTLRSWII
jgi:phenylpyruvate tautomerase PptA (4-oxalocrotonate tautomerase family)